ncbi:hypothetical protein Y032_1321g3825 [Ancylostoma ceylanicum]|uniref:Uncharacterized protein n=1 Tax=Ancylostoma ceylanicum TaxID=53326 RepID=A0A016W784_9BILA|nr:hypothetical protein Y032_1321g3825 [Ancylostoma ceylanicum]
MFTDIRGNLDWICNITGVCPTEEAAEDWNSRGTELPPVNPSTNNDWSDYYETTVEPEPWTPNYWWE